jgi:hypothetical protein
LARASTSASGVQTASIGGKRKGDWLDGVN